MLCLSLFLPRTSRMYFRWALMGCTTSESSKRLPSWLSKEKLISVSSIACWIISIRPSGIVCVVHFGHERWSTATAFCDVPPRGEDGCSLAGGWWLFRFSTSLSLGLRCLLNICCRSTCLLVEVVGVSHIGIHYFALGPMVHQKRSFRGVEIITLLDTYFLVLRGVMSQQYFKRK